MTGSGPWFGVPIGAMGLSTEELSEMWKRHVPGDLGDSGECAECLRPLPCDAIRLLEENDRLNHELLVALSPNMTSIRVDMGQDGGVDYAHALWCSLNSGGECDCQAMTA
jgi:hypothetical protein